MRRKITLLPLHATTMDKGRLHDVRCVPHSMRNELNICLPVAVAYSIPNAQGDILQAGCLDSNATTLSLDALSAGAYVLRLIADDQSTYVARLVIEEEVVCFCVSHMPSRKEKRTDKR